MIKSFVIFFFFFAVVLSAQPELRKWEGGKISYLLPVSSRSNRLRKDDNSALSGFQFFYKNFVSDLDGDNCPFYPSCSNFFVEAVRKTNFLQGSLLFADRFTRDMNFFKYYNHYPVHPSGRFYDPVEKYLRD
ncbi:MAG: membrane protein insertion efficiency factor YidD [Chlorobi bacterium]|nr:membrane protein insertion efficiency factor YidD [Chlorobiota bacterium]